MKSKVYFCNQGYFDIRTMLTFGLSIKGSEDAIGHFGTGFKYAIAIILRLGGTIKITSKGEVTEFTKRVETIKDQDVEFIYHNDTSTGFTTHLGTNWEPWQAFREIYSNCLDEDGKILAYKPRKDWDTVIEIDCEAIATAYLNRKEYFLEGNPIYSNYYVDIYPQQGSGKFFKGVRVGSYDKPTKYTYNMKRYVDLTEDRGIKDDWQWKYYLSAGITQITAKDILTNILKASEDFWEKGTLIYTSGTPSKELIETCKRLHKTNTGIPASAREMLKGLSPDEMDFEEITLTPVQEKGLEKAKEVLRGIGITIDDYPIKVVTGLGDGVIGRALNDTVYLSSLSFMKGTKDIASVLMEEWVHLSENVKDFDYQMQTWLFDKILCLAEEIRGEPI